MSKNVDFGDKHSELFRNHLTGEMDEMTLVLKGHLLFEEALRDGCYAQVPNPERLTEARLTFKQVLNLARALNHSEAICGWMWVVAHKLNRLRNLMAHAIEPDADEAEKCRQAILDAVRAHQKQFNLPEEPHSLKSALCYTYGFLSALMYVTSLGGNNPGAALRSSKP